MTVGRPTASNGASARSDYRTPATTDEAFMFGKRSAMFGYRLLTRRRFLSAQEGEPHPFPSSLYGAYKRGFKVGLEQRANSPSSGGASG